MTTLQELSQQALDLSLIQLIQRHPETTFYTAIKPPLVVQVGTTYYWLELQQPSQTQVVLIHPTKTLFGALEVLVQHHQLGNAHTVTQALFLNRARQLLQSKKIPGVISFISTLSSRLEKQYRDIAMLPPQLLDFMYTKQYSLKQCHYYCRFDGPFLTDTLTWLLPLSPTASQLKIACDTLHDITRRTKRTITEIQSHLIGHSIKNIITELRRLQQPLLTDINEKLYKIKQVNTAPVQWDPTLEKSELTLTHTITSINDFDTLKTWMLSKDARQSIQDMLGLL